MAKDGLEMLHGTMELLILRILSSGPSYGYRITKHLQISSNDFLTVGQGTLYTALYRMEEKGFIKSKKGKTETGRDARIFRMTRKGTKQLGNATAHWEQFSSVVNGILQED